MDDILKIQSISRGNTSRTKILEKGETVVKCLTLPFLVSSWKGRIIIRD